VNCSIDLGRSIEEVSTNDDGVSLQGALLATWDELDDILRKAEKGE
jgi:hypothetical protein